MLTSTEPVRRAAVAGRFYPGSAPQLRADVERMLDEAPDYDLGDRVAAIVAPHAGYAYSGTTAAAAFRQIAGRAYDAIVVIAPSHRESFDGVSVMASGGYETPLGILPVHSELAHRIIEYAPHAHATMLGHGSEHALEVELPFIQCALGEVPIVPIVMLERTWSICSELADAIHRAADEMDVLVVASSDLYHGYSARECSHADDLTLDLIAHESPREFCDDLFAGRAQACGGGPIAVAKEFARLRGATDSRELTHTSSAEAAGIEGGHVVGYGAVAFLRAESGVPPVLMERDRVRLLDLAKRAVRAAVRGEPAPEWRDDGSVLGRSGCGAFVTLRSAEFGPGSLRGCIGQMVGPETSLAEMVMSMAESAALHDPRFEAVRPEELDRIVVEISVLSPMRRVDSPEEVVPGLHGVMIASGRRRGVLLPQVAVENRWTREMFLNHVCLKAGLPATAWRGENASLEVFTAEVIQDDEPIGS